MGKYTNNKYGHKPKESQKTEEVKPTVKPSGSIGDQRVVRYATGRNAFNAYRDDVIHGPRQGEKLMGYREWEKAQQAKSEAAKAKK